MKNIHVVHLFALKKIKDRLKSNTNQLNIFVQCVKMADQMNTIKEPIIRKTNPVDLLD